MKHIIQKSVMVIITLAIMLGSLWLLAKNHTTTPTNHKKIDQPLHVAVVNEDDGSFYKKKVYRLGQDYINQLKDNNQRDWVNVSRSVAENGLKKDEYQLAIFIPHDFSAKVMDINNPSPDKLNIQYKINAQNQKDKTECDGIAKTIIRDMNQRLVDIYTLNVMSNLYHAQNQVDDIYKRQHHLTKQYETQMSQPIEDYSQSFPDLFKQSQQTLKENKALQRVFNTFNNEAYQPILTQLGDARTQVQSLMEEQGKADVNQAKVISQLLGIRHDVFEKGLEEMMAELKQHQSQLKGDIQSHNQNQIDMQKELKAFEDQFLDYQKQANAQLKQLETQFNDQTDHYKTQYKQLEEMLRQQLSENQNIPRDVQEKIETTYKTKQLTVGDFIQTSQPKLYDALTAQYRNIESLRRLYEQLPFASLSDGEKKMIFKDDLAMMEAHLKKLEEAKKDLAEQGFHLDDKMNKEEVKEYKEAYKAYQEALIEMKAKGPHDIVLSNTRHLKGDCFIVTLPNGIALLEDKVTDKVKLYPVADNVYVIELLDDLSRLTLPMTFNDETFHYPMDDIKLTYLNIEKSEDIEEILPPKPDPDDSIDTIETSEESTSGEDTTNSQMESETTTTTSDVIIDDNKKHNIKEAWTTNIKVAPQFSELEKVISKYMVLKNRIAKWDERYQQFEQLYSERMRQYRNDQIPVALKLDLNTPLNALMDELVTARQQQIQELINRLKKEEFASPLDIEQLEMEMEERHIGQLNVIQQMDEDLAHLNQWIKKLNQLSNKDVNNTEVVKHHDEMKQLLSAMNELRQTTADTRNEAKDNNDAFDDVYESFDDFGKTIKEVEAGSKGLNKESHDLQQDFNNELAKSQDFNKAFLNVLNAAYKDGVPNDELLKFIAQPVKGKANYMVNEKTTSYQLSIWILILSILSWLIATLVLVIRDKHYHHYFSKVQTAREKQVIRLILVSVCSLVSGVMIATLSAQPLPLSQEDRIWWYAAIILISLCGSVWCYMSLYYVPLIGTVLNFAMVMLYLFNQQQNYHSSVLNAINVLHHLEQLLLDVLTHQPQLFITLFLMVDAIIMMMLLLVLIPKWRGRNKHEN